MAESGRRQDSASREPSPEVETLIIRPEGSIPLAAPKRKREHTRSPTPPRPRKRPSRSPPPVRHYGPAIPDVDPQRRRERERQLLERMVEEESMAPVEKPIFDPKAEFEKLMDTRAGGTYVPPARLRALQAAFTEKGTKEFQRMAWETLKKSINGLINKVNKSNIKEIAPAIFAVNLVRGRGLYARSMMSAQVAALPYTPIYAALTAIVNTKLPQVGELLLSRLIVQLRRAFKRNDKVVCLSATTFIAHLCNQQVAHEIVALQILALLLERPTDDSVEIAVGFMREVGAFLAEASPKANNGVFERFRSILHEASIAKRVQYMIEVLFQIRKVKYKDHPVVAPELDLVEEEDQITHYLSLDDELDVQDVLGVFKFDEEYEENENKYAEIRQEILGDDSESEGASEGESESAEEAVAATTEERRLEIQDETNTNLTNLRRNIYLTIMSSVDFEECTHKLMKLKIQGGQERELCNMVIECCSQERTYSRFYGLIAERFCKLNRFWTEHYEACYMTYYDSIHRYDANKLRNIARLFGHLLSSDAISWQVMSCVHLNEEETTSSSRIFIKILFQDLVETLGLKQLLERVNDPARAVEFRGLFPLEDPKNTRFSINYFTSIGLGAVTEAMREHLKNAAKVPVRPPTPDDSASSYSSSYDSRSRSRSSSPRRRRSRSRSQTARTRRDRARSNSYSSDDSRRRSHRGKDRSRRYSTSSASVKGSQNQRVVSRSATSPYRSRTHPDRGRDRVRRRQSHSTTPSESHSRSRSRSYTPTDSSRSRSRSRSQSRSRSRTRSPRPSMNTRRQRRSRSYSSSRSRSRSPSRTPTRKRYAAVKNPSRGRSRTRTRSRSPIPPPRDPKRY